MSWSVMNCRRIILSSLNYVSKYCIRYKHSRNFKNWLVLRKLTRYEYEKHLHHVLCEEELKKFILQKGSDYEGLVTLHQDYHKYLNGVCNHLSKSQVDVRIVTRSEYSEEDIRWADVIVTVGGDGTFLLAANKMNGLRKPLLGLNSDPARSEGYLCLSKKYSVNFKNSLDQILSGNFRIIRRQRIRLTLSGHYVDETPVNLLDQELQYPEYRCWEHVKENEDNTLVSVLSPDKPRRVLPVLALNDVFIGESLSARVSFYHVSKDDSPCVKQKSSGITVCTGTGSTSWFFNINHIPVQNMQEILHIVSQLSRVDLPLNDLSLVQRITERFNQSLTFCAEDKKMGYTIRDPVMNGIYKRNFEIVQPRGFCQKMVIQSRMWDGWFVVDGSLSYRFNDGAILELDVLDEDALPCVALNVS